MAKVTAQVMGGAPQQKEADTVGELADQVGASGYTATVNGEPEGSDYALQDYEFVAFAKAVKAG